MFDTIHINADKLPVSDIDKSILSNVIEYQTKSFDNLLDEYYINDDDEIKIRRFDFEDVPPEKRKYPDPNHKLHFIGALRQVNERFEDFYYTGTFIFYTSVNDDWYQFEASAMYGKVLQITGGREKKSGEELRLERENKLKDIL